MKTDRDIWAQAHAMARGDPRKVVYWYGVLKDAEKKESKKDMESDPAKGIDRR